MGTVCAADYFTQIGLLHPTLVAASPRIRNKLIVCGWLIKGPANRSGTQLRL